MRRFIISLFFILIATFHVNAEPIQLATGEWAPYTSQSLKNYGFITEIISQVLKQMDMKPEYHFYPWRRCYRKTVLGEVQAAFPYAYTKDRAKEVLYSEPIFDSRAKFFFYGNNAIFTYNSLDDLKRYRIGGILGYFHEEIFKKAGIKTAYYSSELAALKHLKRGFIDLLPLNLLVGMNLIKKNFPDEMHRFGTLEKTFSEQALHLIVSKKHNSADLWIEKFNTELARFKKTTRFRKLLEGYALTGNH